MKRLTAALTVTLTGVSVFVCAENLHKRSEQVKRKLEAEAARHGALRGSKGELPENNELCLFCHENFGAEELVSVHLRQGIPCAVCHGLSYEHMNDETSHTKPDIMFGRAEVATFCLRCHGDHTNPAKVQDFLAKWKGRTRANGRLILQQARCTDCHGTHAIPSPTVTTEQATQ
ncbi:MAG: cytochrome c3 family protein [Candidatus Zipacnadales bacterium]